MKNWIEAMEGGELRISKQKKHYLSFGGDDKKGEIKTQNEAEEK